MRDHRGLRCPDDHHIIWARPLILSIGTCPQHRESAELSRLSPIAKTCPGLTVMGPKCDDGISCVIAVYDFSPMRSVFQC